MLEDLTEQPDSSAAVPDEVATANDELADRLAAEAEPATRSAQVVMASLASVTAVGELRVPQRPTPAHTRVGSDEFCAELQSALSGSKIWRTTRGLSLELEVDAVDLDRWLRARPGIMCRLGAEGEWRYALAARVVEDRVAPPVRQVFDEADRYVLATAAAALRLVEDMLRRNATKIHERCPESFDKFVGAKSKLEAGVYLLAAATGADIKKLL